MRNRELRGCFRHTTLFGHGEHDMKIPQSDAAADAIRPVHFRPLVWWLQGYRKIELPNYSGARNNSTRNWGQINLAM